LGARSAAHQPSAERHDQRSATTAWTAYRRAPRPAPTSAAQRDQRHDSTADCVPPARDAPVHRPASPPRHNAVRQADRRGGFDAV